MTSRREGKEVKSTKAERKRGAQRGTRMSHKPAGHPTAQAQAILVRKILSNSNLRNIPLALFLLFARRPASQVRRAKPSSKASSLPISKLIVLFSHLKRFLILGMALTQTKSLSPKIIRVVWVLVESRIKGRAVIIEALLNKQKRKLLMLGSGVRRGEEKRTDTPLEPSSLVLSSRSTYKEGGQFRRPGLNKSKVV